MAKNKSTFESSKNVINWRTTVLIALACVLLLVANSAVWASRVFFNTQTFTDLTSQAVLSESSREAIAREIVDTSLKERPVAKRVASATATKLVAGLLDTNLADVAVNRMVSILQTALTSAKPQPITVELGGIKATLQQLIDLTNREQTGERLQSIPDEITLLDTATLPDFYQAGQRLLFLGPISALAVLAMLAYPHFRRRNFNDSKKLLLLQGTMILATGLFAMALGPIFRPTVLAQVTSFNLRIVVQNIYNSFIATFNSQSMWLVWVGVTAILVPVCFAIYNSSFVAGLKAKYKK